jgi:pyruvate/2-oxoglutarate dehydrogenase complex dihydrolipoamide dehydrogenase (E3) component
MSQQLVLPADHLNELLVQNLHPSNWLNPEPAPKYNLVVIGAGTAGLVAAAAAAGLGAKVALIEKHLMGGDCLNFGCIPSKALLRSAKALFEIKNCERFGIELEGEVKINFEKVMQRMRLIRTDISKHDSAERFKELGVDVFLGEAKFKSPGAVSVDGKILNFNKCIIATGGRAKVPGITGLKEAGYLTNETVFSLTSLPPRLAVIGGGPIGCELAQAFSRFGSQVSLFQQGKLLLNRDDKDASELLQRTFTSEGINLPMESQVESVALNTAQEKTVTYTLAGQGQASNLTVDAILVATGRQPNVELDLKAAKVKYDEQKGIYVNDFLQTTNLNVYAIGDVCMEWKFTHAADQAAHIALHNALLMGRRRLSNLIMPWCTYTDPEVAHVGMKQKQIEKLGDQVKTILVNFNRVDRAILDGEEEGFVKVHYKKNSGQILAASIVNKHAGDLISEITLAMVNKIGLGKIANVIYPYPTQAQSVHRASDMFNRGRLTPFLKKILTAWFKLFI